MVIQKGLISIIVPCYNAARYLKDVFLSIENQTYQNIEAIFVDDGSTDDTRNMLDEFARTYSKAKIIHQENKGPSAARNAGVKIARGEYLYFIDSDDIVNPFTLECCLDLYKKYNPDVVMFDFRRFSENLTYSSFNFKAPKNKKIKHLIGHDDVYANYLARTKERAVVMKLFKSSVLRKMPNYPKIFDQQCYYGEDALFLATFFKKCQSAVLLNAKLYNYRRVKTSLMHSSFKEKDLTVFKSEEVFSRLNRKVYRESIKYTHSVICFAAIDILHKLNISDYQNPEVVNNVYHKYRDNLKYLPGLKRLSWPYRFGTLLTLPVIYLMTRKKLKG